MPPSPALRCSPRRELRTENQHRRGHSYESGVSVKGKDEDLALFKDMQMKEREDFLLQSNDDLEETLTKLKCLSDYRLGVNIPVRGENSDLLNADTGKNDYDWLLTPPDTPLFPSLDDDDHHRDDHATRGRLRTQPISIPSPSMGERSQRTSRSSASPHHRSPSPRFSASTSSRGRASSAPHSSPSPALRSTTPVRRSSPNRPSTPGSSTPTHRKVNSGSSMQSSSFGRRGISPSKESRGSSPSPKIQEWQANLLGLSSDAPPNLRTSLSDRPSSYTRGSSPASRSGRETHSKYSRQSMSPTASRSASSSHSYDLDRFSPHSKGSIISSGDEDMDSVRSVSTGISPSPTAKRNAAFVKSKAMGFTKKHSLTPSAFSAPKRSFDSSLRQVDQRKAPQNMFRPLLSSVPSSTFHISKTNAIHRPVFSRNSSLTTSSNASSELGASVIPYHEEMEHERTTVAVEWGNMPDSLQEEESVSNSLDEIKEDISCESPANGDRTCEWTSSNDIILNESETRIGRLDNIDVPNASSDSLYARYEHPNVDSCLRMTICSICNKVFSTTEAVDENDICNDCVEKDKQHSTVLEKTHPNQEHHMSLEEGNIFGIEHRLSLQKNKIFGTEIGQKHGYLEDDTASHTTNKTYSVELHNKMDVPEYSAESSSSDLKMQHNTYNDGVSCGSFESASAPDITTEERKTPDLQLDFQQTVVSISLVEGSSLELDARKKDHTDILVENKTVPSESTGTPLQSEFSSVCSSAKVDPSETERTGISVLLLDRPSSLKGPLVHGRTLTPSLQRVEPSYLRDTMQTIKLNSSWNSSTGSTSLDLGFAKSKDQQAKKKVGTKKIDHAYARSDSLANSENSSSLERSNNIFEDLVHPCRNNDEDDECAAPLYSTEREVRDGNLTSCLDNYVCLENTACQTSEVSVTVADISEKNIHSENISLVNDYASGSNKLLDSSTHFLGQHQSSNPCGSAKVEDCGSGTNKRAIPDKLLNSHEDDSGISDRPLPPLSNTLPDENHVSTSDHSSIEDFRSINTKTTVHSSSQVAMSTKAALNKNHSKNIECPQRGCEGAPVIMKSSKSHSMLMTSEKDRSASVLETSTSNHANDRYEGLSAVNLEGNVEDLKFKKLNHEKSIDAVSSDCAVLDNFACNSAVSGKKEEEARLQPVSSVSVSNIPGPAGDQTLTHRKHTQSSQRINVKNSKTDMNFPPDPWDHAKIHKMPASIEKVECTKPQKLESRCNCSIM